MAFGKLAQIARWLHTENALFSQVSVREWLAGNAFSRIDELFAHPHAVSTRHAGRAVYSTELSDGKEDSAEVFVKLHWGRRPYLPRISDLSTGALFRPLPQLEWRGQQRFRDAGLHVPESLALLQRSSVRSFRSAIIMRAVPVRLSIHDLLRFGKWTEIPLADRSMILEKVATITHRIHDCGLAWRGISCKHFLPERRRDGSWRLWLLDCEGVHALRGRRTKKRDLRKLYGSFEHMGADAATLSQVDSLLFKPRRSSRMAA